MMSLICSLAIAGNGGFETFGTLAGVPQPSAIPSFHVEYGDRLPLRPPGVKVPDAPMLPSDAELAEATDAMYTVFVDRMTADGWTFVDREKLTSDAVYLSLPEERRGHVHVPHGFRPSPLGDGRLAAPRILAPLENALSVETLFSVVVAIQWCEVDQKPVPCLRGFDTAYGFGEPGFTLSLYRGKLSRGSSVRFLQAGGIVKRFTFDRDRKTGANLDRPILPRKPGTYTEQAKDVFEQGLDRALHLFRRKIKPRLTSLTPKPPPKPEPPKPPPDPPKPETPQPTPQCWPADSCGDGQPPH